MLTNYTPFYSFVSKEFIMFLIRRLIAAVIVSACLAQGSLAQTIPAEKLEAIEQLLIITDSLSMAKQMGGLVSAEFSKSIKRAQPNVPQKALDALPGVMDSVFQENTPSLKQIFVGLYDKHYSLDDIQQLLQFYKSPLGQKMLTVQPQLAKDAVQAGARWGQMLEPEILRRVKERLAKEGVNL
jgi:uncharacterized protein